MISKSFYDIVVIGGGFYGCEVAIFLENYFKNILIIEQESKLLSRASYCNQARVHNGYHYPRSYLTATRSHDNYKRFTSDFDPAILSSFKMIYGIAKKQSKISAGNFNNFCRRIGSPVAKVPDKIKDLFNPLEIEEVFLVDEVAFDAVKLRKNINETIRQRNIHIKYNSTCQKVEQYKNDKIRITTKDNCQYIANHVFNCTYSGINEILVRSKIKPIELKYEATEIALIRPPHELNNIGITVMDGPFFSAMPFPALKLHSLSHVVYTPHSNSDILPSKTNFPYMIRDASRFVPILNNSTYVNSLYEIKTILPKNEIDDGRPILFKKDYGLKNLYIILGGKIDNIYDIEETLLKTSIVH